jgi:hypothetical protein
VPDEDTFAHGAMIRVGTGDRGMMYLLLKIRQPLDHGALAPTEDRWYFTGSRPRRHTSSDVRWMTWDGVQTWLGEVGCESWEELVVKSESPNPEHIHDMNVVSVKLLTTDLRENR